MSEITFAKTFLATIDKRPIKLVADHVSDPHKYPNQSPYVLPRQTHPYPRKFGASSSKHARDQSVTVTLKPMRSGDTVTLLDLTLESTFHEIKTQYAQQSGHSQDKIKLLFNKKPAADLKTLSDVGVQGDKVELSVMIMGGTTPGQSQVSSPVLEKSEAAAALTGEAPVGEKMDVDGESPAAGSFSEKVEEKVTAEELLKKEQFWSDLKGFLSPRLRDEKEGEKVLEAFRKAWRK